MYGLTLITLSLVAVQMKVVTFEAVATTVLGTLTVVAALLADPIGRGGGETPVRPHACPLDGCPLSRPPGDRDGLSCGPAAPATSERGSEGSNKPPADRKVDEGP